MKIHYMVLILFAAVSVAAQTNELHIAYQPIAHDVYKNGISHTYYHLITKRSALGLRIMINGLGDEYTYLKKYSGHLELVNRWNLLKGSKFRLLAETGASYMREYEEFHDPLFCGFLPPGSNIWELYNVDQWEKRNYLGFSSSLGADVQVLKILQLGIHYQFRKYFAMDREDNHNSTLHLGNWNISLGLKF